MHLRERERARVGDSSLCDVTRSGNKFERKRKRGREPERERCKHNTLFFMDFVISARYHTKSICVFNKYENTDARKREEQAEQSVFYRL